MGSSQLTVALTPNGHGDCPVGGRFVLPHEERIDLAAFFEMLRDPAGNAVPYIQKQCNSLDEEFGQLRDDIAELEIGKTVFEHLDATNLWIGDERAVSATHSDPYENLYCVVAGIKHVTLYPPTDLPFLYRKTFPVGQYVREPSGSFSIIERPDTVPWISVDPSDCRQFPLYEYASPLEVEVQAGDVLYLPALWYHRVAQSADLEGRTIAVNFWYDMQFDSRYTWMRFQESLVAMGVESTVK